MRLPKEINYAEMYLTLRCGLGCSYCINEASGGVKRDREEMTADEWIEALNRIDFGSVPITLGGGEPTKHKEFFKILQGLPDKSVDLLTNLTFDMKKFIWNAPLNKFFRTPNGAYKAIRVSYHPERHDPVQLLDRVENLQGLGYNVGLFGINHPENVSWNVAMTELARQRKVFFFVKDFLGDYQGQMFGYYKYPEGLDGKPKSAQCRSKELLVAPDGLVYRCHRDLYKGEGEIADIRTLKEEDLHQFRSCSNYGKCNPCDLKSKTNRFLQAGNCQVEIKDGGTKV